jgi:hypothetical protein
LNYYSEKNAYFFELFVIMFIVLAALETMTVTAGMPLAGCFVTEIQNMMHGFGDARTPLLESASLIESVVQQQQWAIISQAADVATMRGVKCIGPEDILFLLRKDRIKMHRLIKYLGTCC